MVNSGVERRKARMKIYTRKAFANENGLNSFEHINKLELERHGFIFACEVEKVASESKSVREIVLNIAETLNATVVVYQAVTRKRACYKIWIYYR